MADWDENSSRLFDNLKVVLATVRDQASARTTIDVHMALAWHTRIMEGLEVDDPLYIGRFRGEAGLEHIGVRIGRHTGTPPALVAEQLHSFQTHLRQAVAYLDERLPDTESLDIESLAAVIEVCAFAHAEWVRIHPFANGNGRTARLWANMIAMRYGLPPFVRLRPRPAGDRYAEAGAQAMAGNWEPTFDLFNKMLAEFPA